MRVIYSNIKLNFFFFKFYSTSYKVTEGLKNTLQEQQSQGPRLAFMELLVGRFAYLKNKKGGFENTVG